MNFKLIKLLGVVCAGLVFVIACEWMYALYAQKQLLESVGVVDKQKKSAAQLPTLELTKRPESSYTDLVARPLFIQGRRPVNEPSAEQTPVTNAATETFNWDVNGIYTYQKKLYALLSRTTVKVPKDNFRKVTVDSDIDGWKLIEIHKDKIIVSQGNKQKELPLRKAKPKDASGLPGNSIGNPMIPPPVPNQPGQPLVPGQQPIPVPEPQPVPEPIIEPELIPDESSETFIENDENAQFQ